MISFVLCLFVTGSRGLASVVQFDQVGSVLTVDQANRRLTKDGSQGRNASALCTPGKKFSVKLVSNCTDVLVGFYASGQDFDVNGVLYSALLLMLLLCVNLYYDDLIVYCLFNSQV